MTTLYFGRVGIMEAEVEIENVKKSFGPIKALKGVSLTIRKNEFFSLLGPSGCGKTTLLRIIAGLEFPDEGIVRLGGKVVNDVPPHRRGVGLVFQGTAVFPHMTVYDNIAFGLKMRGYKKDEIHEKIHKMLEIMNMPFEIYAKKRVNQLSGGERQRVEIARSLVIEPNVLLLDEPLGPLDLKIRQKMQIELKRLQKRVGTTFIYVTHDQGEALTMSDRIAVMQKGEVQQVGTPEEIYLRPVNRFVAEFIGEANLIEGKVRGDNIFEADGLPPVVLSSLSNPENIKGDAVLSIRPEKILVENESLGVANRFEGIVDEKIYMGAYAVLKVRIDDKISLTVQVQPAERANSIKTGQRIQLGWTPDDAIVVNPT